jgi:hypothetical protein
MPENIVLELRTPISCVHHGNRKSVEARPLWGDTHHGGNMYEELWNGAQAYENFET